MATRSDDQLRWHHCATVAKHEILCAAIIIADILDRRDAGEPDWQRLALALQRLRALTENV